MNSNTVSRILKPFPKTLSAILSILTKSREQELSVHYIHFAHAFVQGVSQLVHSNHVVATGRCHPEKVSFCPSWHRHMLSRKWTSLCEGTLSPGGTQSCPGGAVGGVLTCTLRNRASV